MRTPTVALVVGLLVLPSVSVFASDDEKTDKPKILVQVVQPPATRPAILPPLYVSLGALQAYDGYTTLRGVERGARETNALVGGLAGKPAAFWAIKAGSTALTIVLAERLWRDHRKVEAITTMIVANGLMAAIAARNASIYKSPR